MCPLMAAVTAHGQTHSSPLTYYLLCSSLSKDSTPMWGVFWLIYPYSRQGCSYWLRYNERRYREMFSEVTSYTQMSFTIPKMKLLCKGIQQFQLEQTQTDIKNALELLQIVYMKTLSFYRPTFVTRGMVLIQTSICRRK